MDELIRKWDTIYAVEGVDWYHINERGELVKGANSKDHEPLYKAKDIHEALVNVKPVQQKRGKWVFKTVFPNDTSEFPMGYLVCSECGSKHSNKTPCNFCDNCGADMRCSENPNS